MREKPIIFSGEMVKAILDGRKSQTRRPIKPQPEVSKGYDHGFWDDTSSDEGWEYFARSSNGYHRRMAGPIKPTYQVGDRLWVCETWFCEGREQPGQGLHYRANACDADEEWFKEEGWKWKPSIHMPRWASRITLEVLSVRAERLQEITERDARAEGIEPVVVGINEAISKPAFSRLWDSIYAKKPEFQWEANPWVWVYKFKVVNSEGAER